MQFDLGIFFDEVAVGPVVGEEDDGVVEFVGAEADALGDDDGRRVFKRGVRLGPFEERPGSGDEFRLGIVLGLEAPLDDFELERTDGGEEGGAGRGVAGVEGLDDAFLQELFETSAIFFGVSSIWIRDVAENLGGETRDLVVADAAVVGERVADAEFAVADKTDDIARPGFVHGLAVAAEKFVRGGKADLFSGALVSDNHVALEFAGADAEEGDAVAVLGVHVGLDLKDEAGELRVVDGDGAGGGGLGRAGDGDGDGFARGGRDGVFEEAVEKELDAEVVNGGAEVDGRLLAVLDGVEVEGVTGAVEHLKLLADLLEGVVVEFFADEGIVEVGDVDGGLEFAAGNAFEEVYFLGAAIEDAFEGRTVAERPDDGRRLKAEDALEFVEEGDRVHGGPVALVHERENRNAPAAADLEEFARLGFHALGGVDHHEGGIDGGEDAVGVLGEVFVAGGIEEVYSAAVVVELENGGADRDTALFLELHPVGGGGALVFAVLDGAGEVDGVAVEEEFLGQRRLTRVRVGDDGEGAAAGDFGGGRHGKEGERTEVNDWHD